MASSWRGKAISVHRSPVVFTDLPNDLLTTIIDFLPYPTKVYFGLTSHKHHDLVLFATRTAQLSQIVPDVKATHYTSRRTKGEFEMFMEVLQRWVPADYERCHGYGCWKFVRDVVNDSKRCKNCEERLLAQRRRFIELFERREKKDQERTRAMMRRKGCK